jgi:hypothetical protein
LDCVEPAIVNILRLTIIFFLPIVKITFEYRTQIAYESKVV